MTDFVTAECAVSLDFAGGEYVHFGGDIASFKPTLEATFAEEVVYGREFPYQTMTGMTGGIEISGLRTGASGDDFHKEVHVEGGGEAFFAVMHKKSRMLGPAGYVMVKNSDIVDSDGIFRVEGSAVGVGRPGFEEWRVGTILPTAPSGQTDGTPGSGGYPAPVGNQQLLINVVKPGGRSIFSVDLIKGGNQYSLFAKRKNNALAPGITVGYMQKTNEDRVPSTNLTGYRWRQSLAGSDGGSEIYVAAIHLFS